MGAYGDEWIKLVAVRWIRNGGLSCQYSFISIIIVHMVLTPKTALMLYANGLSLISIIYLYNVWAHDKCCLKLVMHGDKRLVKMRFITLDKWVESYDRVNFTW